MPRDITITFADGSTHVYQGAPDDVTPEQVQARASDEFGKSVTAMDGGRGTTKPVGDKPGMIASAAAGLGKGFGQVVLNAQKLVGKGVEQLGGGSEPTLTDLVAPGAGGNPVQRAGRWLVSDADAGLRRIGSELAPYKEANPISAGVGEFGGQMIATAPVGGLLAKGLSKVPGVANMAPNVLEAIRTAGMNAGAAKGVANPLIRAVGGAVNGGATAALIDPESVKSGAIAGAITPVALQLAGKAGGAIGRALRGPEQAQDVAAAVQAAREAGYVIPPTQANPSLANRALEGFSGKLTTAQNASARNQAVTNAKAAAAIGLPAETKITPEVLDSVRAEAGKAYRAVSELGALDATGANLPASVKTVEEVANTLIGKPKTVTTDAGEVVRAWRQANADATAWFRAYARDANPESLAKAKAAASDAKQIDKFLVSKVQEAQKTAPANLIADLAGGRLDQQSFLQKALELTRQGDLAQNLKDARMLIAKTHSVEDALNTATGTIDAKKLAKQLQKGKPLSGDLKDIAEFAGRFPKASQTVEQMGSLPQTSPLDWGAAAALSAATSNPLLLATAAARPAARYATLSPIVQNRLVQKPVGNALSALANPSAAQLLYRSAPVLAADR